MAVGAKESGLNNWVKEFLENNETLKTLPGPAILMIVLLFIATLTSVASNTATAAIVTPVLLGLVSLLSSSIQNCMIINIALLSVINSF